MGYPTKYHNPRGQQIGCCICARKFSSSRYIKYNAKFSEELFCIVFQLKSMVGRRGYLCNPCVLVMKRYQKKLDAGVPPAELPNYSPRVDCCLKRGPKRQRCTQDRTVTNDGDDNEGDGDGTEGSCRSGNKTGQRCEGYRQRMMTLCPRTVFTGKKCLHLKSMYQLLPAHACQDPEEEEEDDSVSENKMMQYRRTTLKKGRKTIREKQEEKRQQDAMENQRLLGDPEDDPGSLGSQPKHNGPSIYKKNQRPVGSLQKIITRRQLARETGVQSAQGSVQNPNFKKHLLEDGSDNVSVQEELAGMLDEEAENSVDSSCYSSAVQSIAETEQAAMDQREKRLEDTVSGNPCTKQHFKNGARMILWNNSDKQAIGKPLMDVDQKTQHTDLSIDALEEDLAPPPIKVSRVQRKPVRGLQPPSVSFIDHTYFQRFQLCCVPVYVGEGGLFVMDCSQMKSGCPQMHLHLQRQHENQQHKQAAGICSTVSIASTMTRSDFTSFSPSSTCSSDLSDGRANLIPSPTESSCANFHFCTLDSDSQVTC